MNRQSNILSVNSFFLRDRASATIYSIIETARENRLNPYAYLNLLFEILPNLDSRDDVTLKALLPSNVTLP